MIIQINTDRNIEGDDALAAGSPPHARLST